MQAWNGGQHQWQGYDSGEWHSHLLLIESNDVVDLCMLGFFFSSYEVGVVNSTNCKHFSNLYTLQIFWACVDCIECRVIYRKFCNSIIGVVFLFDHMRCALWIGLVEHSPVALFINIVQYWLSFTKSIPIQSL
jgi:hypothetical protein